MRMQGSSRIEVAGLIQELQPFIRSQMPQVLRKIADKGCTMARTTRVYPPLFL